jgi:hypothetical protein
MEQALVPNQPADSFQQIPVHLMKEFANRMENKK